MRLYTDDASGIICIWAEARGEPYNGKVGVGEAVRNRTKTKFFSLGDVVSTVWWPKQFSWTLSGDPNRMRALRLDDLDPVVQECAKAWFESETSNVTEGAVQYHAASMNPFPSWASSAEFAKTVQVGGQIFYRRTT
jgi:spore germination cell wall hydrolase CwlJ-like protein